MGDILYSFVLAESPSHLQTGTEQGSSCPIFLLVIETTLSEE